MLAFSAEFAWSAVIVIALLLAVFCFLAILWSRKEWRSRKIRVGLFMEREYGEGEHDEEVTKEWPLRKEE